MGRAIAQTVTAADDLRVASIWVRDERSAGGAGLSSDTLISSDLDRVVAAADVLVDFSLPEATETVIAAVLRHRTPLVCGVSGLTETLLAQLDNAGKSVTIVYDRNMSLGIAVLESIVSQAIAALGPAFDIVIHETHHRHKIDAPSGTALKLGEAIAAVRGCDASEIHYEVERRGEVPGEHTVVLSSATETLSLGHSVTTRQVFADGAVRAARWVLDKPPGLYSMRDVLARD